MMLFAMAGCEPHDCRTSEAIRVGKKNGVLIYRLSIITVAPNIETVKIIRLADSLMYSEYGIDVSNPN